MFTAASHTTAKGWKRSECPPKDEWVSGMWYTQAREYRSARKRKAVLTEATTQMNPEDRRRSA